MNVIKFTKEQVINILDKGYFILLNINGYNYTFIKKGSVEMYRIYTKDNQLIIGVDDKTSLILWIDYNWEEYGLGGKDD